MLKLTSNAILILLLCISSLSFVAQNTSHAETATSATPPAASHRNGASLDLEEPTGFFEANSLQDKFARKITFDQYVTYALRSVSLVAGFDNDLHRYDSQLDLINSFERNLTYGDDLSSFRAHIDSSETDLLQDASELTLIENELNQETCAAQLDFIYEETLKLFRDYNSFTQSKRLDLIDFIDSYGSAPSEQLMMANSFWLGSFDQCRQARIDQTPDGVDTTQAPLLLPNGKQRRSSAAPRPVIRGRYCVAHLRLPSWSRAKQADKVSLGSESIKLGVCLPRSCNSISMLRHATRIEALIRLARLQQVPYSSTRLVQLYCLPDENSPLRQFSPSAKLFIGIVSCWLLVVIYASFKYELARAKLRSLGQDPQLAAQESRLIRVFAFRYACQRLFSEPTGSGPSKPSVICANASHNNFEGQLKRENLKSSAPRLSFRSSVVMKIQQPNGDSLALQSQHQLTGATQDQQVKSTAPQAPPAVGSNLAAIDGIKVISMIWLISAHTLLFFIRNISNGRQFWSILLDARFMTIMAGIFPVDSFFTVTGILTSYLKFNKSRATTTTNDNKQQRRRQPMLTLAYWLEIFVHRYLRFMPMYLLIFWYTRDLSEFIGHGPMWDYATASTSLRSICKRESLWVPVLFQANFKPIEEHCVKPAWYLANDYQYLLITPLFMLLLVMSKWFGYLVIGLSVLASLVMQFLTVYQQQATWWWWGPMVGSSSETKPSSFTDFEALINFKPMFATYVLKDLWRLYVLPYNRIPPYLIGLLTGHLMYCCVKRYNNEKREANTDDSSAATVASNSTESLVSSSVSDVKLAGDNQAADAAGGGFHEPEQVASSLNPRSSKASNSMQKQSSPTLASLIRQYVDMNIWTPIVLLLAVIYLPIASQLLDEQKGERAKIGASLIIALMRLVWSLSVARLIYVCFEASLRPSVSSSFIINLLSSSKWRPWSKICLSVLLIQWEIIAYLAQIQPVQNMTFSLLLAFVIICIIASYTIGLLIYLLFEFPLSQIEQLYISPKLFTNKSKQSR